MTVLADCAHCGHRASEHRGPLGERHRCFRMFAGGLADGSHDERCFCDSYLEPKRSLLSRTMAAIAREDYEKRTGEEARW